MKRFRSREMSALTFSFFGGILPPGNLVPNQVLAISLSVIVFALLARGYLSCSSHLVASPSPLRST